MAKSSAASVTPAVVNPVNPRKLEDYVGLKVTVFCCRYFYYGTLVSFDADNLYLDGIFAIYETGEFDQAHFRDAQPLNAQGVWTISRRAFESLGVLNKTPA